MRAARLQEVESRIDLLIGGFPRFLKYFVKKPPFRRPEQYACHIETVALRRAAGSARAAIRSEAFLEALHRTLRAWGLGQRGSRLANLTEFQAAVSVREREIVALDQLAIDDPSLDSSVVSGQLWDLIKSLRIVENKATVVAGTKALHHVLPNLVVPIDREYTRNFFGWHAPEFQQRQRQCFIQAFDAFVRVARATDPQQYVTDGWNTSRTKVIDNALVGVFVAAEEFVSQTG